MTVEEAIKTSILFERKVRGAYQAAAERAKDPTAKRVFAVLAEEEMGHVNYLESRLTEWQRDGRLAPAALASVLPAKDRVSGALRRLRSTVAQRPVGQSAELDSLRQALIAENETSDFYRAMVRELPPVGQELFARFLAIEDGHAAIVQAEIDCVTQMGFWFELAEFDLEAG
jgi:rubrerythrin